MAISMFEGFCRVVASLDVDKDDLKRYSTFVFDETYETLMMGKATAKVIGRDGIESRRSPDHEGPAGAHPRVRAGRQLEFTAGASTAEIPDCTGPTSSCCSPRRGRVVSCESSATVVTFARTDRDKRVV